jgi:anti-sigma-K factor RskA
LSATAREHQQTFDALGSYVLGALEERGVAAVESHLEQCTECQESLAGMQAVVDRLPSSVPIAAPPPELKARLMADVEAEAELMRAASSNRADRPAPAHPRRRLLGRFSLGPIALAGACTVLLLAGFFIGVARQDGQTPVRTLAATVDRDRAPAAEASLVRHGSDIALVVKRLPKPPNGRIYQVWLQRQDHRAPTPTDALFTVNSHGSGHVAVSGDLRGVRRVLVTAEPPGGSSVPSQLVPLISAPVS